MATNNKISTLIENQLPSFFLDDGPVFVEFIKAYYEWLEQENNAIDFGQNILSYRDVDDTLEEYIQYFIDEFAPNIPESALGDKRLFIKHAIDFYRNKGSEQSFRLLFRLLYNEDITVYYPSNDILRVSDGRWVKETSVRLGKPFTGDLFELEGQNVFGKSSGANAIVDRTIQTIQSGLFVTEIFLINIDGVFVDNEIVSNNKSGDDLIEGTVVSSVGGLFNINPITFGGSGHRSGDSVNFVGAGGSGANGSVITVSGNSAVGFSISDGGSGYRVGEETVNISGGGGVGADFEITSITNTEFIQVNTDKIRPVRFSTLGTSPYFISDGSNTSTVSSNFATANINTTLTNSLAFSNTEVGSIASIKITNAGSGYTSFPNADVKDEEIFALRIPNGQGGFKGADATFNAFYLPGAITSVSVNQPGNSYNRNENINIVNQSRANTENAQGITKVTGVIEFPGKYIDTKGFISWNPRIQDNFYYQQFSYVINSNEYYNKYKEFLDRLIHPSGTKSFGNLRNYRELDVSKKYYNSSNNIIDRVTYWYTGTGSVDVVNGSFTIIGNGTSFDTELQSNNNLKILSGLYTINAISNSTSMTLKTKFEGSTSNNVTFYFANTT